MVVGTVVQAAMEVAGRVHTAHAAVECAHVELMMMVVPVRVWGRVLEVARRTSMEVGPVLVGLVLVVTAAVAPAPDAVAAC